MSFLRRNVAIGVSVIVVCGIIALAMAYTAHAQANAAAGQNAQCQAACAALQAQNPNNQQAWCPPQGAATPPCVYAGPGGSVTGMCVAMVCKAVSASGLGGGSSSAAGGLSQLAQALGQILGALAQQASQSSSAASTPTTGTTGCTTSYYYTSNTALIGSDPCAIYQASAGSGTTCSDPTATNYGQTGSCTYSNNTTCTDPSALNYGQLGTCTYNTNTSGTGSTGSTGSTSTTCTDPTATNYGQLGTCQYNTGTSGTTGTSGSTTNTTCTDPTASNFGQTGACAYNNTTPSNNAICSNPTASNYGEAGACTFPSSSGQALSAAPLSGPIPLAVTFSASGLSSSGSYTIDFGDGSNGSVAVSGTTGSATHMYSAPGADNAILLDQNGNTLASVLISAGIGESGAGSTASGQGGLVNILNGAANLLTGGAASGQQLSSTSPNGQTFSGFPGVFGNILLNNGATIFGSTISGNGETSGFYGAGTSGGSGFAAQMCQGRPWASNFLADVIPPTFFDSLCEWAGFQVGMPPVQQPQVTLQQQVQQAAPTQPATSTVATSTTPSVPAQADIWAVPSEVPLGARTSIFWNTQGVVSCIESSPDGSFSEDSLSGAASTIPLTGATTFTISCLDQSGNPVTDYVTVTISS